MMGSFDIVPGFLERRLSGPLRDTWTTHNQGDGRKGAAKIVPASGRLPYWSVPCYD